MASATKLIDVPELLEIPDPPGGRYELHHGQLFAVTFSKFGHTEIQGGLTELLGPFASGRGRLCAEFPFRAQPRFELRAADVGFVTSARLAGISRDDYLLGAPDLVIEVLSPSNQKGDMVRRRMLCLANGCAEFWLVDSRRKSVTIYRPDGSEVTYGEGDVIPLTLPGPGELAVRRIFSV